MKNEIIDNCKELKRICKHYNLTRELGDLITQMTQESQLYTSIEARENCEEFINTIKQIITMMSSEDYNPNILDSLKNKTFNPPKPTNNKPVIIQQPTVINQEFVKPLVPEIVVSQTQNNMNTTKNLLRVFLKEYFKL